MDSQWRLRLPPAPRASAGVVDEAERADGALAGLNAREVLGAAELGQGLGDREQQGFGGPHLRVV
jgi:hypothetical protein